MRSASVAAIAALLAQSPPAPVRVLPNRPDVTIRTQRTSDHPGATVETTVLQFKGARERRQSRFEGPHLTPGESLFTSVTQCDLRRSLVLNDSAKTFASFALADEAENLRARREAARVAARPHPAPPPGPEITITIDAADTGERRPFGAFVARRVITTQTVEQEGSPTFLNTHEVDGWYIDLGPEGCWDWGRGSSVALNVVGGPETRSMVRYKLHGAPPSGTLIEGIDRTVDASGTTIAKVTLLEFSEVPIDARLFAVPAGYRAALPLLDGGYDFSRPDTLPNRVALYWQGFAAWAKAILR